MDHCSTQRLKSFLFCVVLQIASLKVIFHRFPSPSPLSIWSYEVAAGTGTVCFKVTSCKTDPNSLGTSKFMCLANRANHLECSTNSSATNVNEQTNLCSVGHPQLIWNQSWAISPKMTVKNQSARKRDSGIHPLQSELHNRESACMTSSVEAR